MVSDSQEAGHRVADDGHQSRCRKLLEVEVEESLDRQVPRVVPGDERVVHDLLARDVGGQPELHLDRLLRQVVKLQLAAELFLNFHLYIGVIFSTNRIVKGVKEQTFSIIFDLI